MKDSEVLQAFVNEGAKRAFGQKLHIEGDLLMFDGWWQASIRVSPVTFAVRNEEPPEPTEVLGQLTDVLAVNGLEHVGTDFPLMLAITYAEIALGLVSWAMWAPDLATAEADVSTRAGQDKFLGDEDSPVPIDPDYTAELGGARRLSGLPPSLILTLGVDTTRAEALAAALPDCRFVDRPLDAITPDVCGSLMPTLMVVDATTPIGREFIMELRAAACGRFVPVVALTTDAAPPLGADAAVDPTTTPTTWVEPIRTLLP